MKPSPRLQGRDVLGLSFFRVLLVIIFCSISVAALGQTTIGEEYMPVTLYGSQGATPAVSLNEPPGGLKSWTINIASSDSCLVVSPTSVTQTNAVPVPFTITTTPVAVPTVVTVVFSNQCAPDLAVDVTVLPPALTIFSVGETTGSATQFLQGGTTGQGTLNLNFAAPVGGLPITLASSDATTISLPSTVTALAKTTIVHFPVIVAQSATLTLVTVTATSNGQTLTDKIFVVSASPRPQDYRSGIYLGGPFSGTALNTSSGGLSFDYVWLVAQTLPNGTIWVSTYYGNKPNNGAWSIVKGYLPSSTSMPGAVNGVCLLTGVVDGTGLIVPDLEDTIGVNNRHASEPFTFLKGGTISDVENNFPFSSLGTPEGAAPLQGRLAFYNSNLVLSLTTVSGAISGRAGSLALSLQPPQHMGAFTLMKVH